MRSSEDKNPPGRPQRASYWLITKGGAEQAEVLTLTDGSEWVLPVFSFEEEAEMFLWQGGLADVWQVERSSAGEMVSLLRGPYADVGLVALDPLPEMARSSTIELVSLSPERFLERFAGAREGKPGG